jgi:3-oxoacyl-[acyl-carrier protein] reductase|tara:strand:+ start:2594 stop:3322 length:729 start_codon:yes stop_codon:yes gene_type:complete
LKKKAIAIIGASGVIGTAISRKLDEQGYRLGLHYCSNKKAIDTFLENSRCANDHHVYTSPLNSLDNVETTLNAFQKALGRLDGLILCAGRVPWKNEEKLTSNDWADAFFELSVIPYHFALVFSTCCAPAARIVSLSSISATYGGSSMSRHYGAAKAALEAALLGLAKKLHSQQITVNIVQAGFVLTPQQTSGRSTDEIEKRIKKIPFHRSATPEEIAQAFCFLFDPDSSFITGQRITIAGGD